MSREVLKVFTNVPTPEGRGITVFRGIGSGEVDLNSIINYFWKRMLKMLFKFKMLDPFLIFDEAHVTFPAGFPDHPHRGLETGKII